MFDNNNYGLNIYNNPIVNFTDNVFSNNTSYGVYINSTTPPPVGDGNLFTGNSKAIWIQGSTSPYIGSLPALNNNEEGIRFKDCSSPAIAAGNSILNSTEYGIYFEDCSGIGTIDSLTLTGNGNYGAFRFDNSGDYHLGSGNVISGNSWPLSIDCGSFADETSIIPTSGNTNNDIRVTAGTSHKTGTWYDFADLDYIITENPMIEDDGSLTIEAGNTVKINANKYITIDGILNAVGTVSDSILFTLNGETGTWSYLYYRSGSSGSLSYCKFEKGNYTVYAYGSNLITINNSLFDNNNYGLHIYNNPIVELYNNIMQNNNYGVYISSSSPLLHGNTITGNILDGIKLLGSSIPDLGNNVTEGNDIYANGQYNIFNGTEDISAKYTYWGTDYPVGIEYTIYDSCDNDNLGIVDFEPWSNASHTLMLSLGTSPSDIFINYDTGNVVLNWTVSPDATYYVVLSSPVPYVENHIWVEVATEIYTTSWSKIPDAEKEYFVVISIIAE